MTSDKKTSAAAWESCYQEAGAERLWPQDPTIGALDLNAWRNLGFRTVLDAGCGDGKHLSYLVQQGFVGIGSDASLSALGKCDRYMQDEKLSRDYLLLAPTPLTALPLFDESVDAAICVDVLGHVEDPRHILRELARVVRVGGCIYASIFDLDDGCRTGPRMRPGRDARQFWYKASGSSDVEYYFRFYDEKEARDLFGSSGFRMDSIESRRWREPPHLGYRDEWHEHQSWFAVLQKTE